MSGPAQRLGDEIEAELKKVFPKIFISKGYPRHDQITKFPSIYYNVDQFGGGIFGPRSGLQIIAGFSVMLFIKDVDDANGVAANGSLRIGDIFHRKRFKESAPEQDGQTVYQGSEDMGMDKKLNQDYEAWESYFAVKLELGKDSFPNEDPDNFMVTVECTRTK